jgi:hypothetical protein
MQSSDEKKKLLPVYSKSCVTGIEFLMYTRYCILGIVHPSSLTQYNNEM